MLLNLLCFFFGFFLAGIIETTITAIYSFSFIGTTFLVLIIEELSKKYYSLFYRKPLRFFQANSDIITIIDRINYTKLGLIYGLIVDAFKVGS